MLRLLMVPRNRLEYFRMTVIKGTVESMNYLAGITYFSYSGNDINDSLFQGLKRGNKSLEPK